MGLVGHLCRRNLRLFLRDPVTLVFTMSAPLIMMGLFVVFYRETTAEQIALVFTTARGSAEGYDMADAYGLCDAWLFAACVTLATFACSLGMLASFVEDRASGRFSDYLVSPVRRWQLTCGYISSSFIVACLISIGFLILGQLWALLLGQAVMSPGQFAAAVGATALGCLFFASFHLLWITFLMSQGGLGGYSLLGGITVGFLAYCYVPPVSLSATVNNVVGSLPFAQEASLIRQPVMAPAVERLLGAIDVPAAADAIRTGLARSLGARLYVNDAALPVALMALVLAGLAIFFAVGGVWRMGRVIR
ncbi:MAG: hypothetical protein LBI84_06485 [Propionibacteriaceae bacterium]|jgi:multidrug/hemolysin transport system permease protein|nr:hypothetical protein [Propionibacteriaceae bacterium]